MSFMPIREQTRRVLIVTPQPFYEDRGTPIAVRYVANALSETGVQVDLLAFPVGQDLQIDNRIQAAVYAVLDEYLPHRLPVGATNGAVAAPV